LTRKLEGWACDASISEERLAGALETIREGWENQMEAHAELRKEVMRLTESFQDVSRKQDGSADREASERRAAVDQLAFEIKTVQLATENDFSVMASRLDEIRGGLGNLGHRLDRAEGQQAQAIDAVYRKIEASEAVEALKQRVARDLEALRGQFFKEMENAMTAALTAATEGSVAYQDHIDALKEENARVSARQHQLVQLMSPIHTSLGKADARASEEVERLKAQNHELQQMVMAMMRAAPRPAHPSAAPSGTGQAPVRRAPAPGHGAPAGPDTGAPGPVAPPAAARPAQSGAPAPVGSPTRPPAAEVPARTARSAEDLDADDGAPAAERSPIDLWGRLLGRGDDPTSQRKRRSK
jgi:predicted  nucleic acid-binding Zn-ribbon protein